MKKNSLHLNKNHYILFLIIVIIIFLLAWFLFHKDDVSEASLQNVPEIEEKELSACEQYYRDTFRNATVYGTFEEYPITVKYEGPSAAVDEDSHAVAKRFYSYHAASLENGVTFAGKYTISNWGFTGWGEMFAVIDVETGKVYPFPYAVDWDFDYRADSNLIVINSIESMPEFDKLSENSDIGCDMKWYDDMKTYYFLFENNEFKLLGPEDTSGLQSNSWLRDSE